MADESGGDWIGPHATLSAVAFVLVNLGCSKEIFSTDQNFFEIVADLITFTGCEGAPAWFSFILFMAFSFRWIYLLVTFLFKLFGNVVSGTIALALGVVVFLTGYFT